MQNDEYSRWRELIGAFFIEFAHVENELDFLIIDAYPSVYEGLSVETFKYRATYMLNNIDNLSISKKLTKSTKRILNELIKLADDVRNVIAHNPLTMSLDSLFEEKQRTDIRSHRKRKIVITLENLEKHHEDLLYWSNQLQRSAYEVACELYP